MFVFIIAMGSAPGVVTLVALTLMPSAGLDLLRL
jgi:hypothetical protein